MTIAATSLLIEKYIGNNLAKEFSFAFWLADESDISVTQSDLTGEERVLLLNSDFTVHLNGGNQGGVVKLNFVLPQGCTLAIGRATPINQELDLVNQGAFYAEDHETAFDKLTAICQELKEILSRCLIVPITSEKTPQEVLKEIFEAAKNAISSAISAAKDALRSEEAADRAEAGAQRVQDILNNYESGVICRSFKSTDPNWKQVSTEYGTKYRLEINIGSSALIGVYSGTTDSAEKVLTGVRIAGKMVTIEVPEPFTGFLFSALLTKKVADYVYVKAFTSEDLELSDKGYVLTVPAGEHKCGKTPAVIELVKETDGKREPLYAYTETDLSGNLSIIVSEPISGELVLDGGYLREEI